MRRLSIRLPSILHGGSLQNLAKRPRVSGEPFATLTEWVMRLVPAGGCTPAGSRPLPTQGGPDPANHCHRAHPVLPIVWIIRGIAFLPQAREPFATRQLQILTYANWAPKWGIAPVNPAGIAGAFCRGIAGTYRLMFQSRLAMPATPKLLLLILCPGGFGIRVVCHCYA